LVLKIIITSPSLDTNQNVSVISSVVQFIIHSNAENEYLHFELGKRERDKRNISWFLRIVKTYFKWVFWLLTKRSAMVHFNFAIDKVGLLRDFPLIFLKDGTNGIIVELKSVIGIENAIKLLDNDVYLRQTLSEKSREDIFLNYDAKKHIDILNKIYMYE
jgi:hypothetical protein